MADFQQSNRIHRVRTQVHVALRGREITMPSKLLDGPCWRSAHRQMRAERVTQDVRAIDVSVPVAPGDARLAFVEVHVGPLERAHFAGAEPGVTTEQHDDERL